MPKYNKRKSKSKSKRNNGKNTRKKRNASKKIKGGNVVFPATFEPPTPLNPQSYLPYNDFSNDPNYSVINTRLTQPFLTGVASGGSRRKYKKRTGGNPLVYSMSNALNPTAGQIPSAELLTDVGGVTYAISNVTGATNSYNNNLVNTAPIA